MSDVPYGAYVMGALIALGFAWCVRERRRERELAHGIHEAMRAEKARLALDELRGTVFLAATWHDAPSQPQSPPNQDRAAIYPLPPCPIWKELPHRYFF